MRDAMEDVRKFFVLADQPIRDFPEIPENVDDIDSPDGQRLLSEDLDRIAATVDGMAGEMKAYGQRSEIAFRLRLILSEVAELIQALSDGDVADVADALADIKYVTIGTEIQFGIPGAEVWAAVQAANEAKFLPCEACSPQDVSEDCMKCGGRGRYPLKDAAGKVSKPPGWKPPDIQAVLDAFERP